MTRFRWMDGWMAVFDGGEQGELCLNNSSNIHAKGIHILVVDIVIARDFCSNYSANEWIQASRVECCFVSHTQVSDHSAITVVNTSSSVDDYWIRSVSIKC